MKLLMLWFLWFLIILPAVGHSEICKISFPASSDDCEAICRQAKKSRKVSYETHYETTLYTSRLFAVEKQKRCICLYKPKDDDDVITSSYFVCEYTVTKLKGLESVAFSNFKIPEQPVRNLINVATFQPTQFGNSSGVMSGKLGLASSIIANVYYRGLHYFSSYYALILLTILFAGTLFLFGFGNFFTILKAPQQIWSLLTGTDFKSKSAQVVLAIIFFGLPVNIDVIYSTPITKDELVNYLLSPNVIKKCFTQFQEMTDAEAEWRQCLSISNSTSADDDNVNISNNVNISSSINNNIDEEDEWRNIEFNQTFRNVRVGTPNKCQQQENNYYEKYRNFIECAKASKDKNEIIGSNDNTGNYTSITEGLQVPFASVIVAGFVNFGVNTAEKISKWASEGVKSYFYYKLVYNNAASKKSLESLKNELAISGPVFRFSIKTPKNCGNTQKTIEDCAEIDELFKEDFQKGYCVEILEDLKRRCSVLHTLHTNFNTIIERARLRIEDTLKERYSEVMSQIEESFSFLAPALIPMTIIVYPFQQLAGELPGKLVLADKVLEKHRDQFGREDIEIAEPGLWTRIKNWWTKTKSRVEQFFNLGRLAGNEASWLEEDIGRIFGNTISRDKQTAYWLGYASIMTNIPPGAQVKSFLLNFFEKVFKAAGVGISIIFTLLGFVVSGALMLTGIGAAKGGIMLVIFTALGSFFNTLLDKLSPVISLAVEWAITHMAVNITVMLLIMLPFIAITIAGVVRFIHYLYEIIKTMLVLPFYALPVATRRAEGVFVFFGDLVKLSVLPILIASGVAFAIFFAIIFEFFIFDLPFHLVLSQVLPDSHTSLFLFGLIVASLQLITTFVSVYYLFKITLGFPEYVMNAIGRLFSIAQSREYEFVAQQALEKTKIAMIARM